MIRSRTSVRLVLAGLLGLLLLLLTLGVLLRLDTLVAVAGVLTPLVLAYQARDEGRQEIGEFHLRHPQHQFPQQPSAGPA